MKIIKSFEDYSFLKSAAGSPEDFVFTWGLGDDGYVYYKCSAYADPNEWKVYGHMLPLKTMCKIVKEFGHLLVWM